MNIIVDGSNGFSGIIQQQKYCLYQKTKHLKKFEIATSFSIKEWDDPDWTHRTLAWLDKSFKEGAIAVKVWKNIGMVFKDNKGGLVMIDNPKLDTVFKVLTRRKIPVVGHLGESENCWLPIEEMTTNYDKVYFGGHP